MNEPRRVHAVTPLLNAWKVAAALVVFATWQGRDLLEDADLSLGRMLAIGAGVITVAAIISLIYNYFAWRRMTYGFDAESIYLHQGILFRSQRHVRLDRIQSVDLNQPILARLFGFVSLAVTSAGGAQDNLTVSFVSDVEGQRLRNEILARAAGISTGPDADAAPAPEAPENLLYEIEPGRIFGGLLRSLGFIIGLIFSVALIAGAIISKRPSVIISLIIPIFLQGSFWWQRLNSQFNFRVATSPDGIRLKYGLLDTTARTVPPGRVQAVQMTQPLLWRRKNWWRLTVTVAGGFEISKGEPLLYPVATQKEVAGLMYLIAPNLGVDDPLALLNNALVGTGNDCGFITTPRRARFLDPLTWRRNGYAATDTVVILRRGRLTRQTILVPGARIQSLGVDQGPLEQRMRLANIGVHSTPGFISPTLNHLDAEAAHEFLTQQSRRGRLARVAAGPERWMEQRAPHLLDSADVDTEPPPEPEADLNRPNRYP